MKYETFYVLILVLILIIGGVMWKQRQDAAQEQINQFQAGSKEWQKKLGSKNNHSTFGISGT